MADAVNRSRRLATGGLLCLGLLAAACQADEPDIVLTISTGTSFGECLGNCFHKVVISEAEIISAWTRITLEGIQPVDPDTTTVTSGQWRALLSTIDWTALEALDDVLGCPDCLDGGAEWVEVLAEGRQKKVTFEYGEKVELIQPLIDKLREIRGQFPPPAN